MFDSIARVYELAAARGMGMVELCKAAGINPSTISAAARRGGQLGIDTIWLLCRALGILPAEFFATALDTELKPREKPKRKPGVKKGAVHKQKST